VLSSPDLKSPYSDQLPPQRAMPMRLRWSNTVRGLYVDRRYYNLLILLGGLLPLFGWTMRDIFSQNWAIVLMILAFFVGAGIIFLSQRREDTYHGKPEVDWAWDEMLRRAESSVDIVAGDINWLHDDRCIAQLLANKKQNGCTIRIICKPPFTNPVIRHGIASLLILGAEVRVRPVDLDKIKTTGILTDVNNAEARAALRVRTTDIQAELAIPMTKVYWAKRDLSKRDDDHLELWKALVDSYWNRSAPAVLLERWPEQSENDMIQEALQKVPVYGNNPRFEIATVEVAHLSSWCLIEDKLRLTESVVTQFIPQQIPYFASCFCWSNYAASALLPPIVERHGSDLIVMEGTHRLWHVFKKDPYAKVLVILVSTRVPPPGIPRSISELVLYPHRLGPDRSKYIKKYKEEYWRKFTPMNNHLHAIGSDIVQTRVSALFGEINGGTSRV
jgi:hypothetical protein